MAPKGKTAKSKTSLPEDSKGRPDIYKMKEDGISVKEAAEQAGISYATAHVYLREQEVEHNPDLAIKTKGVPKDRLNKKLRELRETGLRWETLAVRAGMSVAEVQKAVAEAMGVEVEDLPKRTAKPKAEKAKATKGKGKKAAPVAEPDEDEDEDEDEDDIVEDEDDDDDVVEDDDDDEDEDEDEEPVVEEKPKRPRRRTRAA